MAEDSAKRRDWSPGPFLAHLNQRHPDTVLFLARHFIGDEQPTDAQLVGIKGDQLVIGVTTTGGSRTVPLPLTAAVASRSELVDQLAAMLRAAREARPDEPLTSLEVDIPAPHAAGGGPPRSWTPRRTGTLIGESQSWGFALGDAQAPRVALAKDDLQDDL